MWCCKHGYLISISDMYKKRINDPNTLKKKKSTKLPVFVNAIGIKSQRGFVLLLAILVSGIILSVGMSLLDISLKQFKISGIGLDSEMAFQAANAGVECVRYWDKEDDSFTVNNVGPLKRISCMDDVNKKVCILNPPGNNCLGGPPGTPDSGEEVKLQFEWTNSGYTLCTDISVWKFDSPLPSSMLAAGSLDTCPADVKCTIINSRGYSRACDKIDSLRTVERELFVRY